MYWKVRGEKNYDCTSGNRCDLGRPVYIHEGESSDEEHLLLTPDVHDDYALIIAGSIGKAAGGYAIGRLEAL